MALWFFYFFFPGCGFCHLGLRSTFWNGALCKNASSVQWHVEFYAWESCIKQTKKQPNCLIWYPVLKGYVVFETAPPLWSAKTCSVNTACCWPELWTQRYGCIVVLIYLFFLFLFWGSVCFTANAGQRTVIKRRVQLENCQILFKNRRLAHMLGTATFNSTALTCMLRRCYYPMRSWKHWRKTSAHCWDNPENDTSWFFLV